MEVLNKRVRHSITHQEATCIQDKAFLTYIAVKDDKGRLDYWDRNEFTIVEVQSFTKNICSKCKHEIKKRELFLTTYIGCMC